MTTRQKRIVGIPKRYNLQSLIPVAEKLFDSLHREPCSRKTIAEILGASSKSGAFGTKLGALQTFGLLESSRGSYSISNQAETYFLPIDDKCKTESLIYFVLCPKFYREIYDRFCGKPLPSALHNIIAQEKGIPSGRAKDYSEAIRTNFEFAGLLVNGIVLKAESVTVGATTSLPTASINEGDNKSTPTDLQSSDTLVDNSIEASLNENKRATLPLDESDGLVVVQWPKEITNEDFNDISDWIEILKRKIERSIITK